MKRWVQFLIQKGRRYSFILLVFLVISSGLGYLFLEQNRDYKVFDQKILMKKSVVEAFFDDNSTEYLVHLGLFYDAQKHELNVSNEKAIEEMKKMEQFQTKNQFDKEKLKEFLKKYKMSQYVLLEYCKQLILVNSYKHLWKNLPIDLSELDYQKIILHEKAAITGQQLLIKPEVSAKMTEGIKATDEQVRHFIQKKLIQKHASVMDNSRRSGKVFFFNKEIDLTKPLHSQNPVKVQEFKNVSEGDGEESDVLFSKSKINKINKMFAVAELENITPMSFLELTEKDWNYFKKLCEEDQKKQIELQYCLKVSNEINSNNKTNLKDFIIKPFSVVVNLNNAESNEFILSATPKGKSSVFKNYDGNYVIFISNSKQSSGNQDNSLLRLLALINQNKDKIKDNLIEKQVREYLLFWINKAQYE
jgi:hypothetical protein